MNASLRVPPALLRELGKIAAESKRDISDLAEDALRQYVRSHRETVHLTRSRANLRRPHAASLSRSDLRRLERLAREAGTTPARILKTVLRDGFEYTEWFVRRVNEGDADLKAGRVMSTEELLCAIEKQRASRGRKSAAA